MIVPTTDVFMFDAEVPPVPPHDKLICGCSTHAARTTLLALVGECLAKLHHVGAYNSRHYLIKHGTQHHAS